MFREGILITGAAGSVGSTALTAVTIQQLVGRAPISAAEFARRHAAAFTPT